MEEGGLAERGQDVVVDMSLLSAPRKMTEDTKRVACWLVSHVLLVAQVHRFWGCLTLETVLGWRSPCCYPQSIASTLPSSPCPAAWGSSPLN